MENMVSLVILLRDSIGRIVGHIVDVWKNYTYSNILEKNPTQPIANS